MTIKDKVKNQDIIEKKGIDKKEEEKDPVAVAQAARLLALRKAVRFSRPDFCEYTGVSLSTLKSLESGRELLPLPKARMFSLCYGTLFLKKLGRNTYETTVDYILHGKKPDILELEEIVPPSHLDAAQIEKEIVLCAQDTSYSVFKVEDDLMSPFYKKGDVVAGRKITVESQFSLCQGTVCLLETLDEKILLRKVIKSKKQKVTSCILNTQIHEHQNIVEERPVKSIAQVLRHWHLSGMAEQSSPSSSP